MNKIAIVIPGFKVKNHICKLIPRITKEVQHIIFVDDACPDNSGEYVENKINDKRVEVIYHNENQGVGGAMVTGYKRALELGANVIIKIDGDGQMDPKYIKHLAKIIFDGKADYVKGNRFFGIQNLKNMPVVRLIGNSICSFANKITSGYWNIMDPTNGYTAIHATCLKWINLDRLDKGFFFEQDLMCKLYYIGAVVKDIPMHSIYGNEESNLNPLRIGLIFPHKYILRFIKRIFYSYYIKDFNVGSLTLLAGVPISLSAILFGMYHWYLSIYNGVPATAGTVMIPSLLFIVGFQLLLFAVSFDVQNIPSKPFHLKMEYYIV